MRTALSILLTLFLATSCSTKLPDEENVNATRIRAKGTLTLSVATTITQKKFSAAIFTAGAPKGVIWTNNTTDTNGEASRNIFGFDTSGCQNTDASLLDGGSHTLYVFFDTDNSVIEYNPTACSGTDGYLINAEKAAIITVTLDGNSTYSLSDSVLVDTVEPTLDVQAGTGGAENVYCHWADPSATLDFDNRTYSFGAYAQNNLTGGNISLSTIKLPPGTYSAYCLVDVNANAMADTGDKQASITSVSVNSSSLTHTISSFTDI